MVTLNIRELTQKLSQCETLVTRYRLDKDNPWVHVSHLTTTTEQGYPQHYDLYIKLPDDLLAAIAQHCDDGVVRGLYFAEVDDAYVVLAYRSGTNPTHEGAYGLDVHVGIVSSELGELLSGGIIKKVIASGY